MTNPTNPQQQTAADAASDLIEIERLNRQNPATAVEATIEVDGTNVTVSFDNHDATPVTMDTSTWRPSAQTLDQQIVTSETLFRYASSETRRAVEVAASELLSARVWQSLVRVAGYNPAQDPIVGGIQFTAQRAVGEWIQANEAVRESNDAGLTAWLQSQNQQSRAAARQMVADAAGMESSTGVRRTRHSSSESNGSRSSRASQKSREHKRRK